jgi:Protein of Unknown function (DUF2784)
VLAHIGAHLIAVFHLAFIIFVIAGGLCVLRWPRLAWIHLPVAIWGMLVEAGGLACPLTSLENHLRRAAGMAGYNEGFLEHYLFAVIYPAGLTRPIELAIAALVLVVNAGVYGRLLMR